MQAQRVLLTYQDYLELPDDGRRYELHEGELSVTPAPGTSHQRTSGRLFIVLTEHVESHALGEVFIAPVDCILDPHTIVQPDLIYLDRSRAALVSERGIEGPPTLVVEIVSPSSTRIDRSRKLQLYARFGIPYYWIVDPAGRSIEVHVLTEGSYRLAVYAAGSEPASLPPFPDLTLTPASLWR